MQRLRHAPLARPAGRLTLALALLGGSALVVTQADDALIDPEDPPDWSGPYAGGALGFGWSDTTSSQTANVGGTVVSVPSLSPVGSRPGGTGAMLGGQIGQRWQFGRVVLGAAADLRLGSVGGTASQSGTNGGKPFVARQRSTLDWTIISRGEAGYTLREDILLYGFAGLGVGGVTDRSSVVFPDHQYYGSRALAQPGWVAGLGAEYRWSPGWSFGLEFQHIDFGSQTTTSPSSLLDGKQFQSSFAMQFNTVMARANYRFGTAARPSSYDNYPVDGDGSYTDQYFQEINYESGFRAWSSNGSYSLKLGSYAGGPQVSQLSYANVSTLSGEIYGRAGHDNGPFIKGYAGVGYTGGGSLKDEDFPPGISPYSATKSAQSHGTIGYGALDIGVAAIDTPGLRVAPFIGYGLLREQLNAYGCTQVATNQDVCGSASPVSPSVQVITDDPAWHFMRVGVATDMQLTPRLSLNADLAWVPLGGLAGTDTHWLRPDLFGPSPYSGNINGMQLDLMMHYRVGDRADIGIGGRYWQLSGDGTTSLRVSNYTSVQPTRFYTDRYGPTFAARLAF